MASSSYSAIGFPPQDCVDAVEPDAAKTGLLNMPAVSDWA
jgi:hypothetical protein